MDENEIMFLVKARGASGSKVGFKCFETRSISDAKLRSLKTHLVFQLISNLSNIGASFELLRLQELFNKTVINF